MNTTKLIYKKSITAIFAVFLCAFAVYIIIDAKQASEAIKASLTSCLTIVIPSLYAFLVVSNLLVKSNLYILLSKPFYPIAKYVFRIPPQLFSIFILSNIGGYPVGAKLLSELVSQNKTDKKTAERMMCYCYCNSPAFFAGAIGITIFNNVKAGLIGYFSVVLANILIAIITGFKKPIPKSSQTKERINFSSEIFIDSINSGFKTMAMICFMLVFFASIISFVDKVGITDFLTAKINLLIKDTYASNVTVHTVFEISQVSQMTKYCYRFLPLISSLVSLGGLCVLLQITGIAKKTISLKNFWISRPVCIALSGIICYYMSKLFIKNIDIATSVPLMISRNTRQSIIPTVCLILMSIVLLIKKDRFSFKDVV